ncbi:hypothetical protein ACFE04_008710 [Oxalis oulophora]
MLRLDIRPDRITYPFTLKSIAGMGLRRLARDLHGHIMKSGLEFDYFVREQLLKMYVKLDKQELGCKVFDETPERVKTVLMWNVLIDGYCKDGNLDKAKELFYEMPEKSSGSWNSLISGFFRSGDVNGAKELFDRLPDKQKDVVSWSAMVSGLSDNGDHDKALSVFNKMLEVSVKPNKHTVVSALKACAKIGALEAGVQIHDYILNNGLGLNVIVGNALVDMYAKCGNVESATYVFENMKDKDILTWSIMIWGWAHHGNFKKAIECFKQMMYSGIKPDGGVFLALLTACSHSGHVNGGLNFFESMRLDYSIDPTMKHYTSIVDMLGRAGRLTEALEFIEEKMTIAPDFVTWGALFRACWAHKNVKMAELAAEMLSRLEPGHSGSYVFLSNVYAAVGKWEDVERVRKLMQVRGVGKNPGWSYVEIDGQVHFFFASDQTHEYAKEIYLKLEELKTRARKYGYIPETELVLHNIEEEEKEDALGSHSEKLALAFALIKTSPGTIIRIIKNLRVCEDCHHLMKYASKISQREIVLRDEKRFHHFKDGACSCGDYW